MRILVWLISGSSAGCLARQQSTSTRKVQLPGKECHRRPCQGELIHKLSALAATGNKLPMCLIRCTQHTGPNVMTDEGSSLNADSKMECRRHGVHPPAFICTHLQHGRGLGFNQPDDEPDADWPFRQAWCDECERVRNEQGEWNDISEGFAAIMAICEGCFFEIRSRNLKN